MRCFVLLLHLCLAVGLCSGCVQQAVLPPDEPRVFMFEEPKEVFAPEELTEVLQFSSFIMQLKRDVLAHTYRQKEFEFLASADTKNALMLSLLLIVPEADFYDPTRAMVLLDKYVLQPPTTQDQLKDFAVLLRSLIQRFHTGSKEKKEKVKELTADKAELLEALEAAKKDIKGLQEYKKRYDESKKAAALKSTSLVEQQKKFDLLQKELRAEKKKVRELHEKIEQIKMIEEILKHRKDKQGPET